MARLEDVTVGDLEAALDDATGKKATMRLLAAIVYMRGPSVPMIADWFDVREATVYRWFDRLESEPVERAVRDRHRSGRPPKLDDARREAFRRAVRAPPAEAGYERPGWTTALARRFLREEFDVDYSRRHVQRLLKEAGLSWRPAGSRSGPPDGEGDGGGATGFWEPVDDAA